MNTLDLSIVSLLSIWTGATFARAEPGPVSVQPYANVAIDGWTLVDGGAGSGERGFGLIDLGVDLVFSEKLEGHIGGFVYAGNRDVDGFTGDFGVFSNILTETRYNVFTAWLQYSFGHSYIRLGQLASDENFYVSEAGGLFLNSNFGAIPTVSANVAAPIFSVGSAGFEYWKPLETGYFQFGVYAGEPGPGDRDDHGFKWTAGGDAGYFYIAERGWQLGGPSSQGSLFKVGAYFHSGRFESFSDETTRKGNSAFYAIIDQSLSESFSLFGRIGVTPKSEYNIVDRYFDIGFNWQGPIRNRSGDTFGLAYSNSRFAKDFRNSLLASENRETKNEHVWEMTYLAPLADSWQVQPSLQYILNPFNGEDDAIVAGIRLSVGY